SWSFAGGSGIMRETVSYDDGTAATTGLTLEDGSFAFYLTIGEEALQASRFIVPDGSRLSKVYLAPIYDNQFNPSDVPDGAPRDFQLHLWADDGFGGPGAELYSAVVTDSPSGTHLNFSNQQYLFLEHSLPSDNSLFSELPSPVYIGISNTGTDANHLVMTVSAHTGEEVSFLNLPNFGGWAALGDIFSAADGDTSFVFENRAVPIRAEFIISTASESENELPDAITLDQNYPNPFNPSSSISYSLPRSMHVRLSVYDALGRQVATLVDGLKSAGAHQAAVDATGWASGVYMYAIETEASTVTRKMIVLK
ncbi:MAG: T9SS type A sorting domain-containing protein, partial [Rhodothermales bacterium]